MGDEPSQLSYLVKQRSDQNQLGQPPQALHKNPHPIHEIHSIHSTTWKKFGLSSCKCQSTVKLQRSSRTLCLWTGQHISGTKASKNNLWAGKKSANIDLLRICFEDWNILKQHFVQAKAMHHLGGWSHLHIRKGWVLLPSCPEQVVTERSKWKRKSPEVFNENRDLNFA